MTGRVELARDLLPHDLDELLREPRFRSGLIETPKKGTYFVLFNCGGGSQLGSNPTLRRALAGVTRSQDFVWGALGRFALPATGLLPPGILGHDAGRRRALLPREAAQHLLREAGLTLPVRLKAAVHPILQDRFRALTSALFGVWREIGIEVSVVTATMADYLEGQKHPVADILVGRWIADYDDPDDFTFGLFHSKNGHWKAFYSSEEADRILEEARVESRAAHREALYRKFEQLLLDEAVLIPLFHEIDYRIAAPSVRGVALSSTPPFVSYGEISKAPCGEGASRGTRRRSHHRADPGSSGTLDPSLADTNEQAETVGNIFETLTRNIEGGKIVPWLASEIDSEEGGTRFRFRLRRGVRFHDGRSPHGARRPLLFRADSPEREEPEPLAPFAHPRRVGAPERQVERARGPEDRLSLRVRHRAGKAGVVLPGHALVCRPLDRAGGHQPPRRPLEPGMRRHRTLPRRPLRARQAPRAGAEPRLLARRVTRGRRPRLPLRHLARGDQEGVPGRAALDRLGPPSCRRRELRHDPRFASGYRESPRLSTYFVAFNSGRGPLADGAIRRRITKESTRRRSSGGRWASSPFRRAG